MATPTVLVATWRDGLFAIADGISVHELKGEPVRGLTSDGEDGTLAVVAGHTLRQRGASGAWRTIAESESDLSCIVTVANAIYVGTDDAKILRLSAGGHLGNVGGFADVPGRDTWYA